MVSGIGEARVELERAGTVGPGGRLFVERVMRQGAAPIELGISGIRRDGRVQFLNWVAPAIRWRHDLDSRTGRFGFSSNGESMKKLGLRA